MKTKIIKALGLTPVKSSGKVKLGRCVICDISEASALTLGVHLPEAIQRTLVRCSTNPGNNYFASGLGLPPLRPNMIDLEAIDVKLRDGKIKLTVDQAIAPNKLIEEVIRLGKELGFNKFHSIETLAKKLGKFNGVELKVATEDEDDDPNKDTPPWDNFEVQSEEAHQSEVRGEELSGEEAFLAKFG